MFNQCGGRTAIIDVVNEIESLFCLSAMRAAHACYEIGSRSSWVGSEHRPEKGGEGLEDRRTGGIAINPSFTQVRMSVGIFRGGKGERNDEK